MYKYIDEIEEEAVQKKRKNEGVIKTVDMKIPKLDEMNLNVQVKPKFENDQIDSNQLNDFQFDNDPLLNSILENISSVF